VTIDDTMEIKCHHSGLRIFTPEHETTFRPLITPIENAARDFACSVTRFFSKN
jgi:hypothetical protein